MVVPGVACGRQRIFRTLGPAPGYCVPAEQRTFRIVVRRQWPGESVHQYVTDLQCLATLCKFGSLEDEITRDQLAEHTIDPKLQEKLFTAPDNLLLSKSVEMAFQMESAAQLALRTATLSLAQPLFASLL